MTFPFIGTHTASRWKEWGGRNHNITNGGVTVATADQRYYVSPTSLVGSPPLPFSIVDIDVDNCGDIWMLADDGTLRRYDRDTDDLRRIHCTWDETPDDPTGVAVTDDTVYVAVGDSTRGGGIHAFSRHLLQTRWVAKDPYSNPIAVVRHGSVVSVLDGGDAESEPFLVTVGRGGTPNLKTTGFQSPVDLAIDDAGDRYVLDRDPDTGGSTIQQIPAEKTTSKTVVDSAQFERPTSGSALKPDSIAAGQPTGPSHPSELIVGVSDAHDDEHSLFRYRLASGKFERLTTVTGPVDRLLLRGERVTGPSGLYVVSTPGTELSFLRATERTRLNPATGRYDAQLVKRLDAGETGVQWHRLTASLDTAAAGTQVRVYYRATDEAAVDFPDRGHEPVIPLERIEGIRETIGDRLRAAHVRGVRNLNQLEADRLAALIRTEDYSFSVSEAEELQTKAKSIIESENAPDSFGWQAIDPANPHDALLDEAEGRYLWVKVELIGTASDAPRIDSIRAYFPRQSYLRYLPTIYRQDERSAAFLEQYLSLFESVFTDIEQEISAATRYIDPDGAPGDALSWLGDWLALSPDDTWATSDQRTLLREAPTLFKRRGTCQGLHDLLSIYLNEPAFPPRWEWAVRKQQTAIDERVSATDLSTEMGKRLKARIDRKLYIWEPEDLDCIEDQQVRSLYETLLPCPHCFAVMIWPFLDEDRLREVKRLVETTTPAHATGTVIPLHPSLRLTGETGDTGYNTFLGVNSVLGGRDFELGSTGLGTDSKLTDQEDYGQLGSKSRLGTDTTIS